MTQVNNPEAFIMLTEEELDSIMTDYALRIDTLSKHAHDAKVYIDNRPAEYKERFYILQIVGVVQRPKPATPPPAAFEPYTGE